MCALLRYSTVAVAGLLATAYVTVSAENGLSAFRPSVIEPASTGQTVVNRMNKGDRGVTIRDARQSVQNKPATVAKEPRIMEGCDPAFSPLTASAKNNFANRCLV